MKEHLTIVNKDLKDYEEKFKEAKLQLRQTDEDLVKYCSLKMLNVIFKYLRFFYAFQATTRINYEEHITVLTEQVLSLSDQLAESK